MVRIFAGAALLYTTLWATDEKTFTTAEVSRHTKSKDCWLIIGKSVYDVSGYIQRHRDFDYDITRHCGNDVSAQWQNKPQTGDAHSRKANMLLKKYRIGSVAK